MIRTALALSFLAVPVAVETALAAEVDAKASYVVTVGGINVAMVDIDLNDDGRRYGLDLSARVAGLGSVVASGCGTTIFGGRPRRCP